MGRKPLGRKIRQVLGYGARRRAKAGLPGSLRPKPNFTLWIVRHLHRRETTPSPATMQSRTPLGLGRMHPKPPETAQIEQPFNAKGARTARYASVRGRFHCFAPGILARLRQEFRLNLGICRISPHPSTIPTFQPSNLPPFQPSPIHPKIAQLPVDNLRFCRYFPSPT
jgi:hypothetical protein